MGSDPIFGSVRVGGVVEFSGHSGCFEMLPRPVRADGGKRRVGVELELAGLDLDRLTAITAEVLGGSVRRESAFVASVDATRLGDIRIEIDADVLTQRRYRRVLDELGMEFHRSARGEAIEQAVSGLAGLVVPHEIIAPPVDHDRLPELDHLRRALHAAGAKGTQGSVFYAFGLQLNLELPGHDAITLRDYLRAFFCRYEWLVEHGEIDFSRKLTPYIRSFPDRYIESLLDDGYAPDLPGLMDDYLRFNPTRNRPLDLLPLFAWLDRARIDAAEVEHHLIKPRPALHYRLPNCQIDDPAWSLADPWNDWIEVERLAADPESLGRAVRTRPRGRWHRLWSRVWPGR